MRLNTWAGISLCLFAAGCGDGGGATDGGGTGDMAQQQSGDMAQQQGDMAQQQGDMAQSGLQTVQFAYQPAWKGATSVAVIGGFGQATDWDKTQPFVTLADDGSGTYKGSAMLPAGSYPYLYIVAGDADGPNNLTRFVIDPLDPDYIQCPAGSPTAGTEPNPCSVMTVPQKAPAQVVHLTGQVVYDGAGKAGYLVVVERNEKMSHHFFANRVDSDANGNYDFAVTAGAYRVQVWHPTYLTMTDLDRVPDQYNAVRRAISSSVTMAGSVAVTPPAEVSFHDYDKMVPQSVADGGTDALPTNFVFTLTPGDTSARACVFGGMANVRSIGDPWWTGATGTMTSETFDGTFNTTKALTPMVVPGQRYFWGVEEFTDKAAGNVTWTDESMVFQIAWQ